MLFRSRPACTDAGVPPPSDRGTPAGGPQVVRIHRVSAKPMSVEEAVAELTASTDEFLVFTNASNERLAVLYRRRDGNYGLIEPETG